MPGVRQELGVPTKWELGILGSPRGRRHQDLGVLGDPRAGTQRNWGRSPSGTGCGMWGDPGQGFQWEVGVSCAPPSGLGGATPWTPGTKRLCQPRGSVPPCPGNAVTRGPPWCRAPRVPAGGSGGAQPVPAGQRRCQPGPGATAAAAALEPAATSPLPRPLGFWKMPGNGEPPALIWLRRVGAPRPLSRRAVPCRAGILGKRRGLCPAPQLPRWNAQRGRDPTVGRKSNLQPPSLGTTNLAPASVSPTGEFSGPLRDPCSAPQGHRPSSVAGLGRVGGVKVRANPTRSRREREGSGRPRAHRGDTAGVRGSTPPITGAG